MFGFIFKSPAWQLVAQSDLMTKFVLLFLFGLSIFCTWIVICRYINVRREKKAMKLMNSQMKRARTFHDLVAIGKEFREYAGGRFLIRSLAELKDLMQIDEEIFISSDEKEKTKLSQRDVEYLHILLEQSLDQVLVEEERYLPVLGTSAAASPLIGLFGTVWGLVHAFVDISQSKSADISVVAPGIAEALTTTLAGLIVAIPALIFFHYFSNELRKLEQNLWVVSDKFLNVVKRTFL